MKRSRRHYDEWADRLADPGTQPDGSDAVAGLIAALRAASREEEAKIDADALAALLAEEAVHNKSASDRAWGRRQQAPLSPRWRRRAMVSTFLSTLFGKLALGAAGVALATGGLAATGNLPDAAQQLASDAVSTVGIEIPSPEDSELDRPVLPPQASEVASAAVNATLTAGPQASDAPTLPAQASDKAKAVIGKVFEGDRTGGGEFGAGVAETASGGKAGSAKATAPLAPQAPQAPSRAQEGPAARDDAPASGNEKSAEAADRAEDSSGGRKP